MRLSRVLKLLACLLVSSWASCHAQPDSLQQPSRSRAEEIELVFAANLDDEGGCHRDDPRGADLYRCSFDLKTRTARSLKRLSEDRGNAEWFPSLSADGTLIAFNSTNLERRRPDGNRVEIIAADSGRSLASLEAARFPCFSGDGGRLAYSSNDHGEKRLCVVPVVRRDGVVTLGAPSVVADRRVQNDVVEDPAFFPDGKRIAFHRKGRATGVGAAVIGIDGSRFTPISEMNGAGHVAVNPDGKTIVWSRSQTGSLEITQEMGGRWSAPVPLSIPTQPSAFSALDGRLGASVSVAHTYLSWVAPDLLLVSSQGADGDRRFTCSRLFLLKFTTWEEKPDIIDVSGAIEKLSGKRGKDFCTGDGRKTK